MRKQVVEVEDSDDEVVALEDVEVSDGTECSEYSNRR
jgi:hypothetical protein